MQFTFNKNEITNILHIYVDSLFRDSSNVTIELCSKPKSGVFATITVPSLTEVPVEIPALKVVTAPEPEEIKKEKKSPPPLETFIVQEDEPEEENKDNVVTSGSLFSKMGS